MNWGRGLARQFLEVELKRFELVVEDGCVTIIEHGKERPRSVAFSCAIMEKVATFCLNACDGDLKVELKETLVFRGIDLLEPQVERLGTLRSYL